MFRMVLVALGCAGLIAFLVKEYPAMVREVKLSRM